MDKYTTSPGRIGTEVPPDIATALIFGSMVSLLIQTPMSLIHGISSKGMRKAIILILALAVGLQVHDYYYAQCFLYGIQSVHRNVTVLILYKYLVVFENRF